MKQTFRIWVRCEVFTLSDRTDMVAYLREADIPHKSLDWFDGKYFCHITFANDRDMAFGIATINDSLFKGREILAKVYARDARGTRNTTRLSQYETPIQG